MGTIYRNGVPFVGSGGAGGVEMTMAEYELLPESEKMNGAIYFITDGDVSYPSASQMRYDNTESQIPSTTVQGAIDENRIEINALQSGLTDADAVLESFSIRELTLPYTVAANAAYNANLKTKIDATLPTGYKCLGIVGVASNHNSVFPVGFRYSNSDYSLGLKNTSNSSVSTNAIIVYLCMKA